MAQEVVIDGTTYVPKAGSSKTKGLGELVPGPIGYGDGYY